ncbi:MAG: hypothetical protein JXR30_00645 [Alphaproteobacteria bacterium]|nr:hypothetical protein [Alphaproteobacteria bacterium]
MKYLIAFVSVAFLSACSSCPPGHIKNGKCMSSSARSGKSCPPGHIRNGKCRR